MIVCLFVCLFACLLCFLCQTRLLLARSLAAFCRISDDAVFFSFTLSFVLPLLAAACVQLSHSFLPFPFFYFYFSFSFSSLTFFISG